MHLPIQAQAPMGATPAISLRATLLRPLFSSSGDGNGRRPFSVWVVAAWEGGAHPLQEIRAVAELEAGQWGSEGDEVILVGEWVEHPRHGRQFRADSVRPAVPRDARGLARWLARQEGIGPATAQKVVAALGAGALERALEDPSCLDALGLARPQREAVLAAARAFKENRRREEVLVFCHQVGLGPAQAEAVWRRFGERAQEVLRDDPWALAELERFGFLTADSVARALGVDPASPARLRAALHHALRQATWEEGHVYLPEGDLLERAFMLLRETALRTGYGRGRGAECREGLGPALAALRAAGKVVAASGPLGERRVYLPKLRWAEQAVAEWLGARRGAPGLVSPEEARALAERFRGRLDDAQAAAVAQALSCSASILTGGPGTGKTTCTQAVVAALTEGLGLSALELGGPPVWEEEWWEEEGEDDGAEVALAAPTGRAARRLAEVVGIGAKTIHRLLKYSPSLEAFRLKRLESRFLIVDECSMVDLPLMAELLTRAPESCHVLFVGDADQLPPVGPGCPFHEVARKGLLPVARLERVYRQGEGSAIAVNASEVNMGRAPRPIPGDPGYSQQIYARPPRDLPEARREAAARETRERMARDVVEAVAGLLREGWVPGDIQVLVPIKRGPVGVRELNERLRAVLNPRGRERGVFRLPGGHELWVGDRVMQLVNNYGKMVFNGEIGEVVEILPPRPGEREPSGFVVRYETGEGVADVRYGRDEAGEVALAYAATVHKSQGCEFPAVVLAVGWDSYMLLRRNLIYTAITRARERLIVLAEEGALERAAATEDDLVRHQDLEGAARAVAPD
jgi:exodeoxyribonuclease V alpha subunit